MDENYNLDLVNIANDIIQGMIHKSSRNKFKGFTKDEILTYNSALRFLKVVFDHNSDVIQYPEKDDDEATNQKVKS